LLRPLILRTTNSASGRCSAARSATSRAGGFLVQAAGEPDAHLPRHQPSAAFCDGLFSWPREAIPTPVPAASASRDYVYAGVRDEEIAALASEIDKAKSRR